MRDYENLDIEVREHVVTIKLNRPPANALNMALYTDIRDAFTEINESEPTDIRAVILTGEGRFFCAGRDVKTADQDPKEKRNAVNRAAHAALYHCVVPLIAAVNGIALGGGFTFVQEADIIIASKDATFGLPEINIGLAGGLAATKRGMNVYQARKLYFTGRTVDAAYLDRIGMIDQITEPDELMPAAWALASELASKSPVAMRTAKFIANEAEKIVDYEQVNRAIQSRATLPLASMADHKEAIAAFKEKRTPNFTGN